MRKEMARGKLLLLKIDQVRKDLAINERDFRLIVTETTGHGQIIAADAHGREEVLRHLRSLDCSQPLGSCRRPRRTS